MADFTADELRAGLESLPQELYDKIAKLVVTCDVPTSTKTILRRMGKDPMFPVQLHINRKIRKEFAQAYYSNSTFFWASKSKLSDWLDVVPQDIKCLIQDVRYLIGLPPNSGCCVFWYHFIESGKLAPGRSATWFLFEDEALKDFLDAEKAVPKVLKSDS